MWWRSRILGVSSPRLAGAPLGQDVEFKDDVVSRASLGMIHSAQKWVVLSEA